MGLVTLAILAVLLAVIAVAIPAFLRYLKRGKTTEAVQNIRKLFDSSVSYYDTDHVDGSTGTPIAQQFPYTGLIIAVFVIGLLAAAVAVVAIPPIIDYWKVITSAPSATPTFTATPTSTFTATPTSTFTATPTSTFTATPTPTFTLTPSPTFIAPPPPLMDATLSPRGDAPPPPPGGAPPVDADGDGYDSNNDCNDQNPNINPGAQERIGDGIDSNCNGNLDT